MLDRTDLQLMLCEQIVEMGTDELMDLWTHVTGDELEMHNEEQEIMVGEVESLTLNDPALLKKLLGFWLYALGERIAHQQSLSEGE